MDPEQSEPLDPAGRAAAAPGGDDAVALPAPAVEGDVPLPEPMLPSAGVPLDVDDPFPARAAGTPSGRTVPVVRVGRPAAPPPPARPSRRPPAPDRTLLPPLPPGPDPGDAFGPLPGRLDFGDGLQISRRSMAGVLLFVMIPVVAAIGVAVVLSMGTGRSPGSDRGQQVSNAQDAPDGGAVPADPSSSSSSSAPAQETPEPAAAGVRKAGLDDAGDALRAADAGRVGKVEAAWTYRAGGSDVIVAVTRLVTRRNGNFSARAATLRVFTIADPEGKATVVAQTEDPGQTCPSGTEVSTTVPPAALAVRDLDEDGTPEVLVATVHACGSDVRKRVTLFSGAAVYTLTGAGALVAEPDPPYTDWPNGFLDTASEALDKA